MIITPITPTAQVPGKLQCVPALSSVLSQICHHDRIKWPWEAVYAKLRASSWQEESKLVLVPDLSLPTFRVPPGSLPTPHRGWLMFGQLPCSLSLQRHRLHPLIPWKLCQATHLHIPEALLPRTVSMGEDGPSHTIAFSPGGKPRSGARCCDPSLFCTCRH